SAFAQRYEIQVVGREKEHLELWIPAEEVDDLNANLVGQIEVIAHFVGSGFTGEINPQTHLPTDWQ
ncbi:MAG: hypothetical protein Q4C67_09850, partial [Deinococcus sp.]|nr:hypothetical protein [Deinococcus sp.]